MGGADPYYTNVDPGQGNVFYLSQDLRVFTATPAIDATPVAGGPTFGGDSIGGAYQYIQDLLAYVQTTTRGDNAGAPSSSRNAVSDAERVR